MAQGDIMVIDDNPANLKLLEDMLERQGHEVRSFPRGRLALAAASKVPPDLFLLDISMPEMTGYEVCERLKADADLKEIPVIFLSALTETRDKVKAFQSGGVDYISKPFQFEEVQARVETHLTLHAYRRALQRENERLEEAVAARTRELSTANERLTVLDRSKNDFLNLISHEFRTPLHGVLGVGELILSGMATTPRNKQLGDLFGRQKRNILSILDDALLLTQIDVNAERFRSASVSLSGALHRALSAAAPLAECRRVRFIPAPADTEMVAAAETLLVRALQALLETAVRFSREGETICLTRGGAAGAQIVTIDSEGGTIPDDCLAKFFDLFSIGEAILPGGNLGMSPYLAARILSLFGGTASVANRHPSGIRLTVSLQSAAG